MSETRVVALELDRRFGELSSKKTTGSRNPVLLAWVKVSCEFDGVWYRYSPLQLPVGTHRNRSFGFVQDVQKSPLRMGGMSLGDFGTITKDEYAWAMGVRNRTAVLVKAERIRTPELSSVYSKQTG